MMADLQNFWPKVEMTQFMLSAPSSDATSSQTQPDIIFACTLLTCFVTGPHRHQKISQLMTIRSHSPGDAAAHRLLETYCRLSVLPSRSLL